MNEQYWGLPMLSHGIRWLEEIVAILSKPFLMIGFIVSMLDLLTHGQLLSLSFIYYGWALIQAVAVDATFFVVWHKVKKSAVAGRWLPFAGYTLLGIALGVVAWAAMDIQSLEQALGVGNAEALARLNLNPVMLTHLRSVVAVIMGGVVAMISPEHYDQLNTSTRPRSRRLNTKLNTWAVWIARHLGMQIEQSNQVVTSPPPTPIEHPEEVEIEQVNTSPFEHFAEGWTLYTLDTEHPGTDPFSHIEYGIASVSPVGIDATHTTLAAATPATPATLPPPPVAANTATVVKKNTTRKGLHVVGEDTTIEQRIRKAYTEHPAYSDRKIAKLVACSPATAGKWKRIISDELNTLEVVNL